MKKIFLTAIAVMLLAGIVFAVEQAAKPAEDAKVMTYMGTIIDNLCATTNKANLGEFVKTHTKKCALMPNCAASGYSLYMSDGKLMPFDKAGNKKIVTFLKKKNVLKKKYGELTVTITASEANGELSIVSIQNHEAMKDPVK